MSRPFNVVAAAFAAAFPQLPTIASTPPNRRESGILDRRTAAGNAESDARWLGLMDRRHNEYRRFDDRTNFDVVRRNDLRAFDTPDED